MVSLQEQVQDVRQSIVESPDTFQYTCFHLEHKGERINDFVELSEVKELRPDSELVLVEDPYTEKEARAHLVRIRELIGIAGDRVDYVHGIQAGLSLHDTLFPRSPASAPTSTSDNSLEDYDFSGTPNFDTILPPRDDPLPRTLKSLSVSPWNPPPLQLRQRGHLLYIQLTTNEGEQYHITGTVAGFYVSKSSSNRFDPFPRAAPKNHSAHSLLTLISLLSPSFNSSFSELQIFNGRKDLLTTFPFQNAIPANPWLISPSFQLPLNQQPDPARAQEAFLIGGSDGAENLRDWNEEFQTTRELPRETLQDRIFRERLTSKLFADYNDAAVRGAVLVARGEVAPLNPTEGRDAQIYIHNNIFYSFGADGVGTFASEGGDEAARVAVGKDVAGVRAVNQLDIQGLYTPGTVVVDYLGKRIVGQSIVPGIFKQREAGEHQIDYGGVEGHDVVTENEAFVPVFEKLSKSLRVKRHAVWDKDGKRHDLEGSVETKGLLGTDGRKYVLDLYRITPLDVAWADDGVAPENLKYGTYPHRMSILRPELVEGFWRLKMQEYVKGEVEKKRSAMSNGHADGHATQATSADSADQSSASKDVVNDPESATQDSTSGLDETTSENDSGSKKDGSDQDIERIDVSDFHFALNPDVCSGQVPQTEEEKTEYTEDEKDVRALCDYLRSQIVPGLISDLYDNDVGFPMDGVSLTQLMHKRGINIRYLGKLATLAEAKGQRLQAFLTVTVQEMVTRAFKHIVNRHLRHLPAVFAPSCISHLLNCLLGSGLNPKPHAEIDEDLRSLYKDGSVSFEGVTVSSLRNEVESQVKMRYHYDLPDDWQSSLKPLQILREICLRLGLQVLARTYSFLDKGPPVEVNGTITNGVHHDEGKKKKKKTADPSHTNGKTSRTPTTFTPDDILNITPLVKDAAPKSALADEALEAGRISLAQMQKQLGQELVLESLSLHEQIYGILHPEVAKVYHQLSMIYYQNDEKEAAVELARKAVIVTERTLGVDSHDAVLAYLNLSLFEHHLGNTKQALLYVRHALEIWKIIFGPNHPDSITTMNNAAVMLQSLKLYSESRKWFEACYTVCENLFGKQTINAATILFQLAQALALDGDAKGAVNKMRDAYSIFHAELGANDKNTKEAESWLEQLTQNAVSIAKQAKDLQNRRIRRVAYMPRMGTGLGARLQPQPDVVGQTARGETNSNTLRAPSSTGTSARGQVTAATATNIAARSTGLDSRSIDELLRYIEGGSEGAAVSPRAKQKKRVKQMNPKLRRKMEVDEA